MSNPIKSAGNIPTNDHNDIPTPKIRLTGSTQVGKTQINQIFNNVNENLNKNPHFNRRETNDNDQGQKSQRQTNRGEDNERGDNRLREGRNDENNGREARGNRRDQHASTKGLNHGKGHQNDGETPQTPRPNIPQNTEIPTVPRNQGNGVENASEQGLQNGKGLPKEGNQQQLPNLNNGANDIPKSDSHNEIPKFNFNHNQDNNFQSALPKPLILSNYLEEKPNKNKENNSNDNRENNFTRQVVRQVLRDNGIFVNKGVVNKLLTNSLPQNNSNKPNDLTSLVQTIKNSVYQFTDNPQKLNGKAAYQLASQISSQLHEQIQSSKPNIFQQGNSAVKHFEQLGIKDRMLNGVELMPKHLPTELSNKIQTYQPKEILNGLLLVRGLILGQENAQNLRNFVISQPRDFNLTAMRDVGQLVKVLIADSVLAKSAINLDFAVQKFIRILLANNELGVLLASINLASQTRLSGGLVSRSLALAQIYELITRLTLSGEKAMKQEMLANAAKNLQQKSELGKYITFSTVLENEEKLSQLSNNDFNRSENILRQFLEFNPAYILDKSVSAFDDSEKARQSQQDFISLYQDDIERWLRSGNHRLVKEINLDKPLGIVIERNNDEVYSANTVRMVLVRDSSVQGWHFLKSFLVN